MPVLRIDLQEGFSDDAVVVRVNGRAVFDKQHVRTRLQIGLADTFEIDIAEAVADVTVSLPEKGMAGATRLALAAPTFLAVSIDRSGSVIFRQSSDQFGYL